jgi:fatty acid CoA ligase FadD9
LHVQGYEIPRDFIVEPQAFSKENHLLTDSGKPARGKLKAKCVHCLMPKLLSPTV